MWNLYHRFSRDFKTISAPVNALIRKEAPSEIKFRKEKIDDFDIISEKLWKQPILALPKPKILYVVDTDANDFQVGHVVQQRHRDNILPIIGFFSKKFSHTERRYDTTKRNVWKSSPPSFSSVRT